MDPQALQARIDALQAQIDAAQAQVDQNELVLFALAAFLVGRVAAIFVHEAGHAVMAWRAGYPVRMVRVGQGPALLRWQHDATWFVLRLVPVSGRVTAILPPQPRLGPLMGYFLGGIIGNAVLMLLMLAVLALNRATAWWAGPVALAQAATMLNAAIPYTRATRAGRAVSDGLQVWRAWRGLAATPWDTSQAQLAQRLGLAAPLPAPSPALAEVAYHLTRPERLRERWVRRDSNVALRAVLAQPGLTWLERAAALDELVLREVRHHDGLATDAELDAWSAEALALAPTAELAVMRAGALVRLRRLEEAEALLGPWGQGAGSRDHYAKLFTAQIEADRARARLG